MQRREPSVVSFKRADPGDSFGSILRMVLVWLCVFFLLYKAFLWWEAHKKPATQQASFPAAPIPKPTPVPNTNSAPPAARVEPQPTPHDGGQWSAGARTVTKCVVNGHATFTDQECPHDSVASSVTVNTANVGTVAPRTTATTNVQVDVAPAAQLPTPVVRPPVDARSLECPALELQIKQIDAMARQPQSGQIQDALAEQKKKLQSRQFALHC